MKKLALLLLIPSLSFAQGIPLKDGTGTNTAGKVDANNNQRVSTGPSVRPTYVATVSGATTTAAYNLQCESSAGTGFKVTRICVSYALGATAAGVVITTTVARKTTASSGGTALTNNGTGTTAVTQLDPTAAAFGGLCRGLAATLGTAGAVIDQWQFPQTVVAGTTGITQPAIVCRDYPLDGGQAIINAAGVNNGIAVNVSAGGAGSLAVGSISMWMIQE